MWRWRLLVGAERRRFVSPLYGQQNTLIAEAGVGWSPSGMTTISATVSRETEDAEQEGVSGLVYSVARSTIDHEYLRPTPLPRLLSGDRRGPGPGGYLPRAGP